MNDIRWKQRFQNFERAFLLLKSALENGTEHLSDLEKEGVIQRFEVTTELAWKTLKDYLNANFVVIKPVTPKEVIKQAFIANIIPDGDLWITILEQRNLLSHTYSQTVFNNAVIEISKTYLVSFEQLFIFFKERVCE